jgi:putative transposase
VIGLYKTELVWAQGPWRTAEELELATLLYVERFNTRRIHSEIGYVNPIEFENDHYRRMNTQPQPRLGEPSLY